MLNPSQYAVGGTGHPKFIPQVLRHNLEAQNSRTFAEVVQGFHGRVKDRKQLGITIKGKMTQLGEEKIGVNPRLTGAKMGDFLVGKPDKMEVGGGDRREQCINKEIKVGKQNPADIRINVSQVLV